MGAGHTREDWPLILGYFCLLSVYQYQIFSKNSFFASRKQGYFVDPKGLRSAVFIGLVIQNYWLKPYLFTSNLVVRVEGSCHINAMDTAPNQCSESSLIIIHCRNNFKPLVTRYIKLLTSSTQVNSCFHNYLMLCTLSSLVSYKSLTNGIVIIKSGNRTV